MSVNPLWTPKFLHQEVRERERDTISIFLQALGSRTFVLTSCRSALRRRFRMRHLLLVAVALWTGAVWAQESYHSPDPDLLVRLSYKSSLMASDSIRQICIEVSQQGDYRILSSMSEANGPSGLEGKMSQDQL